MKFATKPTLPYICCRTTLGKLDIQISLKLLAIRLQKRITDDQNETLHVIQLNR